jgi:chromosome segregation ATPase
MDEAALITLQNEISELEQELADKKHRLEEARTSLEKQTSDAATIQKPLSGDSSEINTTDTVESATLSIQDIFHQQF